jgi:predicted GIY-YIG superfamily endonuclease
MGVGGYVYIFANDRNGTLNIGVTNDFIRLIDGYKSKAVEEFTKNMVSHGL